VASRARALLAPLTGLAVALAVAGCVSVPSAGPVLSYPVAQQTSGQNGQNVQDVAAGPTSNWQPNEIVTGFLTAAAAIGDQQVAREYLTPQESKRWNPSWSANVYSTGPYVETPQLQPPTTAPPQRGGKSAAKGGGKQAPERAQVVVEGHISASLSGHGTYAVRSSSTPPYQELFELEKVNGQWRISSAPSALLLTQGQFAGDYELRNLYFFDPDNNYLVPDPVYVPLQASPTTLMNHLVNDLIAPQKDWLTEGATQTAFPAGTKFVGSGVTLTGGTATVDLGGAIASAPNQRTLLAQVTAQLLWTLIGSGQGASQVTSVQLEVNGQPKYPQGNSQGIAVQRQSEASYTPAFGASSVFYYVNSAGYLCSRDQVTGKQVQIAKIGTAYSQIAVSPDGKYLAALRRGSLYMGSVDGSLTKRAGSGYTTISWDPTDTLWATTGGQILALRGGVDTNSPQARPIAADLCTLDGCSPATGITALRVAPDGVRVALIIDSNELSFGAIVWQQGTGPGLGEAAKIEVSPFSVSDFINAVGFTAVTWYGPNDVITLGSPGSTLTEYPVNGGTSTSQLLDQSVDSISASSGQALIAGVAKGGIFEAPTLTSAWAPVAVKGTSPTYPG
jgi:hypothetical protein